MLTPGFSLKDLGHDVVLLVLLTDVVHGEDVGVRESGDGPGLLTEACQAVAIVDQAFREELDRDVSAEPWVTGSIHLAHSPAPDEAEDLIGAEACAWLYGHVLGLVGG
jgi:hypothetical protein